MPDSCFFFDKFFDSVFIRKYRCQRKPFILAYFTQWFLSNCQFSDDWRMLWILTYRWVSEKGCCFLKKCRNSNTIIITINNDCEIHEKSNKRIQKITMASFLEDGFNEFSEY